jgi:hypothetical protein
MTRINTIDVRDNVGFVCVCVCVCARRNVKYPSGTVSKNVLPCWRVRKLFDTPKHTYTY